MSKEVSQNTVSLLNQQGEEIGVADVIAAHQYPVKLHRASSVWLSDDKGRVLLQQRSPKKIVGAYWWGNTVCGNVRPGETVKQCAERRLKEELGIMHTSISESYTFKYSAYCNEKYGEHELDTVFVGTYSSGKVKLNPKEVVQTAWINFSDLLDQIKHIEYPFPSETLNFNFTELKEKVRPIEVYIDGRKATLAPWIVLMLRDPRLQKQFA